MNTPSRRALLALSLLLVGLTGCTPNEAPTAATTPAPWVRTAGIEAGGSGEQWLSGTVRARQEAPVAFQLGGRVLQRHVDAGQRVRAGQPLFSLDPRDVDATVQTATAQLAAAEAAMQTAQRELERQRQLVAQGFVSPQSLDRLELSLRDTVSRLDSARAQATQARNARGYAQLLAPRDGVMTEVMVEAGQVVTAGQTLGVLAPAGAREVEVHLPSPQAPTQGRLMGVDGPPPALRLREIAGAADAVSRSWRARYLVEGEAAASLALGSVVRVALDAPPGSRPESTQRVPLGALDERADGPRLWRVVNGQAESVPIEVLAVDATHAHIRSPLAIGDRVVSLGTHRLTAGMAVRELAP